MITATFDAGQTKKLIADIQKLPKKLQNKILREEARKAAKTHLLSEAKAVVPKRTGALKKSLKVRALKRSRVRVGVRVGMAEKDFKGDTFYGSFLEYGWRHGKRRKLQAGETDQRKKIPGKYWLKSVVEKKGDKAQDQFLQEVSKRVETELRQWLT